MTREEYSRFYVDFIVTILGPSVKREANCDLKLQSDLKRQAEYENQKNGLVVLALVSFIESNFLQKADLKQLRQFQAPQTVLPPTVNAAHLSCFIFLRDCFAHNPAAVLLGPGTNTSAFTAAVTTGTFPWASVAGQSVTVDSAGLHELHLIVLRFLGENV
jgi:hypothetical protein